MKSQATPFRKLTGYSAVMLVLLTACGGGGGSSGGGTPASPAPLKAITAFSLAGVIGTINETNKTISVNMQYGTNVTALVATFSTTGRSVKIGSTIQSSGVTANDFTNPVTDTSQQQMLPPSTTP
jgi:hypothetical protein